MKITEVRTYPVADERGVGFLFVKVLTDAGIFGLGESGIRWWGRPIEAAIQQLGGFIEGRDPWATEALWQEMSRSMFFPADGVYSCAIAAIDIALWDIKAKAAGLPLYKLLGGPVRDKVVCYPHTQGPSTQALLDNCKRAVDTGWKFVRWGQAETGGLFERADHNVLDPDRSVDIAVEQMGLVREALGPDIGICFDVHTRLDPPHVIRLCREVEPFRPFFIEDPIRSEHSAGYRTLARHVNVPIAAGEQWSSKWEFREVIESELIRYARIDLCIAGGMTESLKITHAAETHFIDIAPHNPLGPVSGAACVALCMASTNVGVQEMPWMPGSYAKQLFPVQVGWEDGYAFCHDTPGLGVEFDEDVAAASPWEPGGRSPQLRRSDGAFTNW